MHKELRTWHSTHHGQMRVQLDNTKKAILFFDQIEEKRNLTEGEFIFRQLLRQRSFHLAKLMEIKWSQRARCKWLAEGDDNTRFFHAYASSRLRQNTIISIQHEGQTYTDEEVIRAIFLRHMERFLGTASNVLFYNLTTIYPTPHQLTTLL